MELYVHILGLMEGLSSEDAP